MSITKHIYLLALSFIFSSAIASAQDRLPSNVPTPGAAAICQYGDIPVSYYTGTPDITIPLHTFTVRDVDLPIYLSYNASGVRLHQLPSWTGENWTLHAGGCITRTINGFPDEYKKPQAASNPRHFYNYFECYDSINYYMTHQDQFASALRNEEEVFHDLDPDVFHFNFMGHNGSFFLGNDGEWKVAGSEDFDILLDIAHYEDSLIDPFIKEFPIKELGETCGTQPQVIKGFTLRDKQGNIYEFGGDDTCIEYTTPLVQTAYEKVLSWNAVSWYLKKVTDRLGNVLYTFNYSRGMFVAQLFLSYYQDAIDNSVGNHWLGAADRYEVSSNSAFPYNGEVMSPVYLDQITTGAGHCVVFISDYDGPDATDLYPAMHNSTVYQGWRDMSGVNYVSGDNKCAYYLQTDNESVTPYQYRDATDSSFDRMLCRTRMKVLRRFSFRYSGQSKGFRFFYNTDTSRMHLVKLQQFVYDEGGTGNFLPLKTHYFEYDQYDKLPPSYVSTKVDHWGYCRQAKDSQDYIYNNLNMPVSSSAKANYYNTRTPNRYTMKYGSLKKIIYPTGGASVFEYEPNRYSQYQDLLRQSMITLDSIGGGIRVKSIAEYEDSACTKLLSKRTFAYSGGELFVKPVYYWPNWLPYTDMSGTLKIDSFRSCSIIPLSNSYGPSVGYSCVTETRQDGSKIIRNYQNISTSVHDELNQVYGTYNPTPYDVFSEHGYMRGRLLSEQYYDRNNCKVRGIGYVYGNDNSATNMVKASSVRLVYGTVIYGYKGRLYNRYFPRYDRIMARDTLFYGNNTPSITNKHFARSYATIQMNTPYTHQQTIIKLDSITTSRGNHKQTETFSYALSSNARIQQFYIPQMSHRYYRNNMLQGGDSISFSAVPVNGITRDLITNIYHIYSNGSSDVYRQYVNFTSTGRPSQIIEKWMGGIPLHLTWANNDNYLAVTMFKQEAGIPISYPGSAIFNEQQALHWVTSQIQNSNNSTDVSPLLGIFNVYVYHPSGSIIAIINSDGTTTHYEYDHGLRLTDILDTNLKSMKHYEYQYTY